ncbi:hypothetical protein [Chenggangzhangella methanolivorans]|uniref:Uncharacterized protein n=1 Tax=Chenggangzhangella methanolivorans TaxID=1437009 RepID=A0A9E6R9V5_9HYPH|nr:hypothetical protein [Chenggangzhangella methanolivorans]QZO00460.1 hypothetical protein K6K41_01505 [Chenggangzhangella methanolivorans]
MSTFVTSGLIADLALAALALEAALIGWLRRSRGGEALMEFGPFIFAGAALMIALRAALVGWPETVILAALTVAGVAQFVDLVRRLQK